MRCGLYACPKPAKWKLLVVGCKIRYRCERHIIDSARIAVAFQATANTRPVGISIVPIATVCFLCWKPCDESGSLHQDCIDREEAIEDAMPPSVTWAGLAQGN